MDNIFNTNLTLLYKKTENKYIDDDTVDIDEMNILCDELYRHELLKIFNINNPEFEELTQRIMEVYQKVKNNPDVKTLIETNMLFDEEITFMSLFSYNTMYIIYPVIVKILQT